MWIHFKFVCGRDAIDTRLLFLKKAGCEYTHTCATSDFTKKIIRKLGNETMTKEIRYEDIRRDKKGRPFFLDTGVHQSMQTFNVDHRSDK